MSGQRHAQKALELVTPTEQYTPPAQLVEQAQVHALLAIYEELRLMNNRMKP